MNRQYKRWASVYQTKPEAYDMFAKAQDTKPLIELLRLSDAIKSKSILDVGTGTGKYAFLLSDNGASEVIGIDRCYEMINFAKTALHKKRTTNIKFLNIDIAQSDFFLKFDSSISAWAINAPWNSSYASLDKALHAVFKSLKNNGRFFLITTPPGEMAGELAVYFSSEERKIHFETKASFLKHLKTHWGFYQETIRADWNFQTSAEAALYFSLFYKPELAEVILRNNITTVKANAAAMVAVKQD
jgi:predicted RNA methylase